jgi:WD40 repeat protein
VTIRIPKRASEQVVIPGGLFLVTALKFSPDSRLLAAATVKSAEPFAEHDVIVWDVARGKRAARLGKHPRCAHCLAFSPDGTFLAVGVHGGFKLWKVNKRGSWQANAFHDRRRPGNPFTVERPDGLPPIDAVTSASFTPDGNSILLLVRKSELFRWEVDKQRVVGQSCRIPGKVMNTVSLLPQNGQAVTSGFQLTRGRIRGEVCIWDVKRRTVVAAVATTAGRQHGLLKSCVSADGKIIAAMENFRIWVWDVSDQTGPSSSTSVRPKKSRGRATE